MIFAFSINYGCTGYERKRTSPSVTPSLRQNSNHDLEPNLLARNIHEHAD